MSNTWELFHHNPAAHHYIPIYTTLSKTHLPATFSESVLIG